MRAKYVEPASARHRVVVVDGVERLRIPHYRRWFTVLIPSVLLAGWTALGIKAVQHYAQADPFLFAKTYEASLTLRLFAFLGFQLCAWLLVSMFLAWMLIAQFGAQTLRVQNGDLEASYALGFRYQRFRGKDIRNLQSAIPLALETGMTGAVRFDYGLRTVSLATGVGEPEGRVIVDWLARRLPRTATTID